MSTEQEKLIGIWSNIKDAREQLMYAMNIIAQALAILEVMQDENENG